MRIIRQWLATGIRPTTCHTCTALRCVTRWDSSSCPAPRCERTAGAPLLFRLALLCSSSLLPYPPHVIIRLCKHFKRRLCTAQTLTFHQHQSGLVLGTEPRRKWLVGPKSSVPPLPLPNDAACVADVPGLAYVHATLRGCRLGRVCR